MKTALLADQLTDNDAEYHRLLGQTMAEINRRITDLGFYVDRLNHNGRGGYEATLRSTRERPEVGK